MNSQGLCLCRAFVHDSKCLSDRRSQVLLPSVRLAFEASATHKQVRAYTSRACPQTLTVFCWLG